LADQITLPIVERNLTRNFGLGNCQIQQKPRLHMMAAKPEHKIRHKKRELNAPIFSTKL